LVCEAFDAARAAEAADVLFLAQESGAAMRTVPELLEKNKRVIDLSADFRISDAAEYERWYKIEHQSAHLLQEAVYGLPELGVRERLRGARLVANPGCYPTATLLALAPLLTKGMIEPAGIVVDAKSGVSGAGRSKFGLDYHFAEANEALKPYNIGGAHRHVPEIEQALSRAAAPARVTITFSPHLIPMTRGLLATCYARLTDGATTTEQVLDTLRAAYADTAPFVVVREAGDYPSTKHVQGSNYCHIGARADARTGAVTVVSVIDNLVKGAAGQAVQNLNGMLGLPETLGLEAAPLWP
jgi:N-acetyl-gamma-glutamyl-phosphate reductase